MKNVLGALTVLVCIVLTDACQNVVSYPPEPHISLKSFTFTNDSSSGVNGKLLTITLNFTDGDGDLFTPYQDTASLRSKVHLTFYQKVNGTFIQVPDSFWQTPYNFSLPYSSLMDRNGQNKTQKGTIEFSNFFLPGFPFDTAQVGITIMDMAFHQSNEVMLPQEFVFK
jgi:hypothetical protein